MRFRDFHPNVKLRIMMSFFTNTLSNMVTPFMAIYFVRTLGNTVAGAATIVTILIGLAFATLGGYYADQIGRKKMMLLSESIFAASYFIMALMNSSWFFSPVTTMIMTMVISAAWGLNKPAVEAMLIDVSTPDTRKFMYRITYWSNNLAISIAGIVGAFLFKDYLFELFLAVAAMSLVTLVVTAVFLAETMPKAAIHLKAAGEAANMEKKKESIWSSYKQVVRDKTFMAYVIGGVLLISVETNLTGYIAVRLGNLKQELEWLPWFDAKVSGFYILGFLRTENTLAVVILSLFIGRLFKLNSDARTMLIAMALNIIGYIYLTFSNQPILLILFMLIATIGELLYVPIKQAYLANMIPDHARSSYMAIQGMTYRAALIVSGVNIVIGGFFGPGSMAIVIGLTGVIGLLIIYTIIPSMQQRRAQSASVEPAANQ
jgi:MFS transporter, DHA1 family, multidrug resistance protein B